MPTLPLAVEIADAVAKAAEERRSLDAEAVARRLADAHPDADATPDEILEVLKQEGAAAASTVRPK